MRSAVHRHTREAESLRPVKNRDNLAQPLTFVTFGKQEAEKSERRRESHTLLQREEEGRGSHWDLQYYSTEYRFSNG
jgi:hypothetical protein